MTRILRGIGVLLVAVSGVASAEAWVSGGRTGAYGEGDLGSGWYGRATVGSGPTVLLTHSHLWLDHDLDGTSPEEADLKETSLMIAAPSSNHAAWFALGPARVQVDGSQCEKHQRRERCVALGLAGEIGVAVPIWFTGIEVRVFGDLNPVDRMLGFALGLRFGGGAGSESSTFVDSPSRNEVVPSPPSPPLAPGQSAKLRSARVLTRPQGGAPAVAIPAGATVTIKSSLSNNEGTWWYVEAAGQSGWARAEDLDVAP